MKKTYRYILLAAGTLVAITAAAKLAATQESAPSCGMTACTMGSDCCMGMGLTTVAETSTNAVPDQLKTCPVSGDKLGGDMGEPYVFVYQGQEVKLCCKSCKKDFDKEPAKYMKLIRAADKK